MIFAHVIGIPVEESALALAPAGAAIVTGLAVVARSTAARIVGWLRYGAGSDPDTPRPTGVAAPRCAVPRSRPHER
jgi:hypothetical protein